MHTVGEVLSWLDSTKFTFINSIPKTVHLESLDESERLFKPDKLGNWFERFCINIGLDFTGHTEGEFFVINAKNSEV